jgi:hypothetical protein
MLEPRTQPVEPALETPDQPSFLNQSMVDFADLPGEWIGFYPGHFDEVVKIRRDGDKLIAIKVTGDDFVPEGEITWWVSVHNGVGEGQIAEEGFANPAFVQGALHIVNDDRIVFTWRGLGQVEYRRDD